MKKKSCPLYVKLMVIRTAYAIEKLMFINVVCIIELPRVIKSMYSPCIYRHIYLLLFFRSVYALWEEEVLIFHSVAANLHRSVKHVIVFVHV